MYEVKKPLVNRSTELLLWTPTALTKWAGVDPRRDFDALESRALPIVTGFPVSQGWLLSIPRDAHGFPKEESGISFVGVDWKGRVCMWVWRSEVNPGYLPQSPVYLVFC